MKQLSKSPNIHPTAIITQSKLGDWTEIAARTTVLESEIGNYSYVMEDCHITYAKIGKFVSIAAGSAINPNNHPMWRASQHHFTYRSAMYGLGEDDAGIFAWRRSREVILGHDVWIGNGAMVLPGNRVGVGAVVAAGAVVTKDVPAYTVVAGVPARFVRERFAKPVTEKLLAVKWWDWPQEKLRQALEDFRASDVREFVAKYGV
jgi:phosphonate metabolism protein (transferase hexapeptide repeat family)